MLLIRLRAKNLKYIFKFGFHYHTANVKLGVADMHPVLKRLSEISGIKIGPPKLTKYEKARIVSARALQLALGAPPLIDVSSLPKDPVLISMEELKRRVLPITIVRIKPNGERELIPVRKLMELEESVYKLYLL